MTNKIKVQFVVFCGGSRPRIWSLCRADFPMQFLSLTSEEGLAREAVGSYSAGYGILRFED